MLTPMVVNIITYSAISIVIKKRKMNSVNNVRILARGLIVVVVFTLSWLPSIIFGRFMGVRGAEFNLYLQLCFYINTLTDPILYTVASPIIVMVYKRVKTQVEESTMPNLVARMSAVSETLGTLDLFRRRTRDEQSMQSSSELPERVPQIQE